MKQHLQTPLYSIEESTLSILLVSYNNAPAAIKDLYRYNESVKTT